MTLKFTLFSTEVEDFVLELMIDANKTFADLQALILKACNYQEYMGHRFYLCNEDWRPKTRILQEDDGTVDTDEDLLLMDETVLGDYLEDEGQHLAYRFDPDNKRMFLIELSETIFGNRLPEGKVNRRHGQAPDQILFEDEPEVKPQTTSEEIGEEFYGDDGFEEEEIDMEGFGIEEN